MGNGAPHVLEGRSGHIRMANQVVRLTNQLLIHIPADAHKRWVAMCDFAFGVGAGNQQFVAREIVILLCDRQIQAHALSPPMSLFIHC